MHREDHLSNTIGSTQPISAASDQQHGCVVKQHLATCSHKSTSKTHNEDNLITHPLPIELHRTPYFTQTPHSPFHCWSALPDMCGQGQQQYKHIDTRSQQAHPTATSPPQYNSRKGPGKGNRVSSTPDLKQDCNSTAEPSRKSKAHHRPMRSRSCTAPPRWTQCLVLHVHVGPRCDTLPCSRLRRQLPPQLQQRAPSKAPPPAAKSHLRSSQ